MLKNHKKARFALRAVVLTLLASLALAPGLARNQASLNDLLSRVVPSMEAPAITATAPVFSPAPQLPAAAPLLPQKPDQRSAAAPHSGNNGDRDVQTRSSTGPSANIGRRLAANSSAGHRHGVAGRGIGGGAGITGDGSAGGSPEKSVATAKQTFAPADRDDRDDHSDPDVSDNPDETGSTPTDTPALADNPSLADNAFHDEDTGPDFSDKDTGNDFPGNEHIRDERPVVQVPEPSGLALLAVGLFCLALCRHLPR